jgi:mannosyltransferase OCH1-like enzyme
VSISIYYSATRMTPIGSDEIEKIRAVTVRYSVNQRIEEYMRTRQGLNWESFDYHFNAGLDSPIPDAVWQIRVEDHPINWNSALGAFDPHS